ncbi:MAG: hypothetical protein V4654_08295 [Bdellovibrionota bacterium]
MSKNLTFAVLLLVLHAFMSSCAAFDDKLYAVSDALKGDFRSLANSTDTTLDKVCRDLGQNQVVGSSKWTKTMISFPVVVSNVSGEYGSAGGFHVAFNDYYKSPHNGHAWTRSANLANQEKVTNLKVGDKIKVTGILNAKLSNIQQGKCALSLDKANFEILAAPRKPSSK